MLGIVDFSHSAFLRIFFIFRKKKKILRNVASSPQEKQGKKLSVRMYHLLTSKPQVLFCKVYSCAKKTYCLLMTKNVWYVDALPYHMSFLCSSVSPFVK